MQISSDSEQLKSS